MEQLHCDLESWSAKLAQQTHTPLLIMLAVQMPFAPAEPAIAHGSLGLRWGLTQVTLLDGGPVFGNVSVICLTAMLACRSTEWFEHATTNPWGRGHRHAACYAPPAPSPHIPHTAHPLSGSHTAGAAGADAPAAGHDAAAAPHWAPYGTSPA